MTAHSEQVISMADDRPDFRHGIRYIDVGGQSNTALVLVHGLGNSLYFWNGVVPLLREEYRVVALDIPGYGKSEVPSAGFALEPVVAQIHSLLDELDVRAPVVVGHSMGGLVAAALAKHSEVGAAGLVLVNACLSTAMQMLSNPRGALKHKVVAASLLAQFAGGSVPMTGVAARALSNSYLLRATVLRPFIASAGVVDPSILQKALAHNRGRGIIGALRLGLQGVAADAYEGVPVPVALIFGDADWLMVPADLEACRDALNPVQTVRLKGVGHWPMIEQPLKFVEALTSLPFVGRGST